MINLCLGSIYSYSVLQIHLKKFFENVYGLKISATEMQIPFLLSLALFSFSMPLAGRLIERFSPRKVSIVGAIFLGSGWFLASFAKSPLELAILYGIIVGLGVGIIYNCPLSVVTRWFIQNRGLAIGLTVLGFGLSPALLSPIIDLLVYTYGLQKSLKLIGVTLFLVVLTFSYFLRFPDKNESQNVNQFQEVGGISTSQMLKKHSFYGLWICFFTMNFIGLIAIGISKPMGLEVARNCGIPEQEISNTLTLFMIPFALSNGIGRPLFGFLTDKFKPKTTATLSFLSILVAIGLIYFNDSSLLAYGISFSIFWMNLGGWMAIAPTTTSMFFGLKNYSSNYGVVFTAYGVGAILGNLTVGIVKDITGSFINVFPILSILIIMAIIIVQLYLNFNFTK